MTTPTQATAGKSNDDYALLDTGRMKKLETVGAYTLVRPAPQAVWEPGLGEADWRTPPAAGGEELFRALKYRKIPTVMVRFPNEGHDLSRSGQPWHRIERLQHIVGWFDKWLLGVPKPEYEVTPR